MKPIENCILKLEARIASCYIQMLKLATAINRLPSSKTLNFLLQNLQSPQKFDHEACLFPLYHGTIIFFFNFNESILLKL